MEADEAGDGKTRLTANDAKSDCHPDVRQAVSKLDEFGIATKDYVQ
jgi:hypothetical protein